IEAQFDVAAVERVDDAVRAGFGHAYGFIANRLFRGRTIPMIPVLLNTYYPPNPPTPRRCYEIGTALRAAIDSSRSSLRIAAIASGGLSHFVVDEPLDRKVLKALASGDADTLRSLPAKALRSGSSEIRNWIVLGGMLAGLKQNWSEYRPIYRTEAGTGIGI